MQDRALSNNLRGEEKQCAEETEACAQEATYGCHLHSEECAMELRAQATLSHATEGSNMVAP